MLSLPRGPGGVVVCLSEVLSAVGEVRLVSDGSRSKLSPSSGDQGTPEEGEGRVRRSGRSWGEVGVCPCAPAEKAVVKSNMQHIIALNSRAFGQSITCLSKNNVPFTIAASVAGIARADFPGTGKDPLSYTSAGVADKPVTGCTPIR